MANGLYISNTIVKPLKTYECRITVPGYKPITCKNTIPAHYEIVSAFVDIKAWSDEEGMVGPALTLTFKNDPKIKQYYQVTFGQITPLLTTETAEQLFYEIQKVSDSSYDELIKEPFFSAGRGGVITGNITDPILLSEGLPLALFSNENIPDTTYTMSINFVDLIVRAGVRKDSMEYDFMGFRMELRSVSYEYYQYARQRYMYDKYRNPDLSLGSSMKFSLYSNVSGGYGIFAGFSSDYIKRLYVEDISKSNKLNTQKIFILK